jgi:hypothetical protein
VDTNDSSASALLLPGDQPEESHKDEDGGVQRDQALGGGAGPPDPQDGDAEQDGQPGDAGEEDGLVPHGNTRRW